MINNLEMKSIRALLFIPRVPRARDTTEATEGGGAPAGAPPICRRTFTLTLPEFSGAAGALPRLRGGRPSHLHLGVLAETAPPTQDEAPLPTSLTLTGRPRSAPARPPSKPGLWWRLSHTPVASLSSWSPVTPRLYPSAPRKPVYPQPLVAFLAGARRGPPFPRTLRASPLPTLSTPSPGAAVPICAPGAPAPSACQLSSLPGKGWASPEAPAP